MQPNENHESRNKKFNRQVKAKVKEIFQKIKRWKRRDTNWRIIQRHNIQQKFLKERTENTEGSQLLKKHNKKSSRTALGSESTEYPNHTRHITVKLREHWKYR